MTALLEKLELAYRGSFLTRENVCFLLPLCDSADERNAEEASESSGAACRGSVTCCCGCASGGAVCWLERMVDGGNGGYIEGFPFE